MNHTKAHESNKPSLKRKRAASGKVTMKPFSSKTHPGYKWVVYWPTGEDSKRRLSKRFKTKKAAGDFRITKEVEVTNRGRNAAALSASVIEDARWAETELAPYGVSIRDVVADFVKRKRAIENSARIEDAILDCLEDKETDKASARYLKDLENRLKRFGQRFGQLAMAEIEPMAIDSWLRDLKVSSVTRNNYRRVLGVFFTWGKLKGYCIDNPVSETVKAKEPKERVEVFTAGELRVILDFAPVELLPFLAIGAFAGLRAAEIERLDWLNVDLLKGRIAVDAAASKTAAHRYVPISETLRAWLEPLAEANGAICPRGLHKRLVSFRRDLDGTNPEARKTAKKEGRPLIEWKDNALRHSFASYSLAQEEDAARVALWLGHTSPSTTFKHYRERVDKDEAAAYFGVLPCTACKITAIGDVA